jgi:hypothetical protein
MYPVPEFLYNLWGLGTEYSSNRVVVPARQATQPGEIGSLEPILGLLKSLTVLALAGRYGNSIPTRFLAPIDCLKIPALIYAICVLK